MGTWAAAPDGVGGLLASLNDLHVWLGLKNSDDQGTRFDLRAEVYKNGELVSSGETLCITDITRNASKAKEVAVSFASFDPVLVDGSVDSLSIKILARIGTDGSGNHCGGHSNAVGLRLYFDSEFARRSSGSSPRSLRGSLGSDQACERSLAGELLHAGRITVCF